MRRKTKKPDNLPVGCPTCNYGRLPFVAGTHGFERCDCPRGIAPTPLGRAKEMGR